MFLKRRFWSHWSLSSVGELCRTMSKGVAIGAIALLFAACDDDSGSFTGPENESEIAETSSSSKVKSSSSEKKISSSSVGKIKLSSSQKTISSSSASEPKSSSSVSKTVLSSSIEKSKSSSSASPESSSSSSQTVVLSSDSHEESSGSSFNGWSWDVPKEARLNPEITYGTMTDSRDGKTYKTVKIGNQIWMAENLNYADSVTTTSLIDESWCYNDVAANCDVGGRLYSWFAAIDLKKTGCGNGPNCLTTLPVQGICPEGWHLPDSTEWNTLFAAVGGASTAGKMLKSQGGWNNDYDGSIVKGIDAYGFSALPVGHRYNNGFFSDEGRNARFWTASEDSSARDLSFRTGAYYVTLLTSIEKAFFDSYVKSKGHSVRCVMD